MNNLFRAFNYSKSLIKYQQKACQRDLTSNELYLEMKEFSSDVLNNQKIKVNVFNKENLNNIDGSLILPNHQSNLDIPLLINALDLNLRFIAKKQLNNIPFCKKYLNVTNTYLLDRDDARDGIKVLKKACNDLNNNHNIVLFCEGTRSKSQLMSEFKTGALTMFKRCQKPLIPVYIDKSYLLKNNEVNVIIGKPIEKKVYQDLKTNEISDLVYDSITNLKRKFNQNKKYRFIGLGDSITFGENNNQEYIDSYYDLFINKLRKENMVESSNNFSIPSLSIKEIRDLIENNNYESYLKDRTNNLDLRKQKKLLKENNVNIIEKIKEADYLIMTCGSNDMLKLSESKKVEVKKVIEQCNETYRSILALINYLRKINKDIHIIIFGFYFPYPHSKALTKYNKMPVFDKKLKRIKNKKNVSYISVYKQVEFNKDIFLPNKRNIHFSELGYEFYKNELVKEFQRITRND